MEVTGYAAKSLTTHIFRGKPENNEVDKEGAFSYSPSKIWDTLGSYWHTIVFKKKNREGSYGWMEAFKFSM